MNSNEHGGPETNNILSLIYIPLIGNTMHNPIKLSVKLTTYKKLMSTPQPQQLHCGL